MHKINQPFLVPLVICFLLVVFFFSAMAWRIVSPSWTTSILPGVRIDDILVGGLSSEEAIEAIEQRRFEQLPSEIILSSEELYLATETEIFELHRDIELAVREAQSIGREGPPHQQLLDRMNSIFAERSIGTTIQVGNEFGVYDWVETASFVVNGAIKPPSATSVRRAGVATIEIFPGDEADVLDEEALYEQLQHALELYSTGSQSHSIYLQPITRAQAPLTADEQETAQSRAQQFVDVQVELYSYEEKHATLGDQELLSLLAFPSGYNALAVSQLTSRLIQEIARPPTEPIIEIEDGEIIEFQPPIDGLGLETKATKETLTGILTLIEQDNLENRTTSVFKANLPVERTSPNMQLDQLNPYGIKELLGVGESFYRGSIVNRQFNVNHTADLIQYTLIPPGKEYSFNQSVGEISGRTGFKSAYIIQGGRTVLGDGGGVCQVSTTIFRAALDAGLPITMRRGHSYRVGYYEQGYALGLDATVYSPTVDFRFQNDTTEHIVVVTKNNPTTSHLLIELWGTSDGRTSELSDFKTWGHVPAKQPVYIDDPALPAGRVQQIDWAAAGARASFAYKVTRDGEVLQDRVFSTVYQPWASVYLRGTAE